MSGGRACPSRERFPGFGDPYGRSRFGQLVVVISNLQHISSLEDPGSVLDFCTIRIKPDPHRTHPQKKPSSAIPGMKRGRE